MNNPNLFHVIKDPVHGTMQFTTLENNWIKPFIDSPNFQRLRHIKQLGMGDFIFPGAVHTRFNHCIGCCYVASQIAHKIGLAEEERQLVMIACLLHDIGHGPFSHTFEDLFTQKLIRHEAWTPYFLAEFGSEAFFATYNQRNPRHHLTPEKFTLIKEMIMHQSSVKRVSADIVSSQLDADRLDYLLRDSHFCGVSYGEFDFRWMLNSMVIVNSPTGERLGLTHKGIGVIEHYLMARRLMTRNIYHYQKKLALEFFLVKLLASLAENLKDYPAFLEIKSSRLGKFLIATNQFNTEILTATNSAFLVDAFLAENYSNYKELCDYDIFAIVRWLAHSTENHPAVKLAKRIHYRQMPKIIRINHANLATTAASIEDFRHQTQDFCQDWQLALIQSPHQSYSIESDPILIINEHGTVRPLNEMSLMIDAISDKYEHTAFLCIDAEIYPDLRIQKFIRQFI
jgi:HD superfamily phosphohydrolase